MTTLDTRLNPRSADFLANAAVMQSLVDDLKAQVERVAQGGARPPAPSTPPAASCCRVTAWPCCWTPVPRFWNWRRWPR